MLPGELISEFSETYNLSSKDVTNRYREMMSAGFITSKGRGRSAAPKTVDDVVWLTLACLVGGRANNCAQMAVRAAEMPRISNRYVKLPTMIIGSMFPTFFEGVRAVLLSERFGRYSKLQISGRSFHAEVQVRSSLDVVDTLNFGYPYAKAWQTEPNIVTTRTMDTRGVSCLARIANGEEVELVP